MRLSQLLLLSLLGIGLVPLVAASYVQLTTSQEALKTAVFERHQEQASRLSKDVEGLVDSVSSDLQDYASPLVPVVSFDQQARQQLTEFILFKRGHDLNMVTLWRFDPSATADSDARPEYLAGARRSQVEGAEGHQAQSRALWRRWLEAGRDGSLPPRPKISPVYRVAGQPAVTVALTWTPSDTTGLLLSAELDLQSVQQQVSAASTASTVAYVVGPEGHVIAHPDEERVQAGEQLLPAELADPVNRTLSGTRAFTGAQEPMLGAWAPVPGLNWTVIVSQPQADALAVVRDMRRTTLAVAVGALVGALLLALYLARSMSTPLQRVVSAALRIARGVFGARAAVTSRNEIGELAHTFNYMSARLSEYDAESKRLYRELEQGYLETIRALANSIDAKDAYTRGHSQRVTELSVETARELGLSDEEVKTIQFGAILHDIGKIGIKDSVLRKAAPLTDEEFEYMKTHPVLGVGIIDPIDFLSEAKRIVRSHHERYDGRGYPDGLRGDEIPVGAQIVNIADSYDAMVTQRPYNKPMPFDGAVARLQEIAGTQHDPKVTEAFLRVLFRHRAEEEVGGIGRATRASESAPTEETDDDEEAPSAVGSNKVH